MAWNVFSPHCLSLDKDKQGPPLSSPFPFHFPRIPRIRVPGKRVGRFNGEMTGHLIQFLSSLVGLPRLASHPGGFSIVSHVWLEILVQSYQWMLKRSTSLAPRSEHTGSLPIIRDIFSSSFPIALQPEYILLDTFNPLTEIQGAFRGYLACSMYPGSAVH